MAVPAPSKASVPSPAPKPPKPGIDIFTQIWPRKKRKGRKRRGHNPPARYGLLRNFFAYIPKWLASLQYRLVMMVDSVSHTVLFVLVLAELLGLDILSGRSRSVLARPLGSARRLLSLAYDSSLGILQLLLTAPRLFFAFPNDDVMVILRRVAILQCCLGSSLHYSSVVRWKTRSCEYRVPPLLILVAYFLLPWTTLCGFLLLVRPGDHKVGSVTMDLLVLAAFAALRVGLFGRYGRPRMPRAPQPWWMRLVDAAVLGSIMLFLELGLLRNAWIERRKNWKYVFAGLLLALPVPFWRYLLRFFREERDGVKKAKGALKADRADRVTREDVRADIYGKLRPGVPIGADIPSDVPEKLRARRVFQGAKAGREAAPAVPKLPVLGLQASPTRSKAGSDG